ncbi:hypothetical protein GMMP15_270010 [Candidatus Magnetomoraceae bacterium gMMP-15]
MINHLKEKRFSFLNILFQMVFVIINLFTISTAIGAAHSGMPHSIINTGGQSGSGEQYILKTIAGGYIPPQYGNSLQYAVNGNSMYALIKSSNITPLALDLELVMDEDMAIQDTFRVLDTDSTIFTYKIVDNPVLGSLTITSSGTFTYTPNANINGIDSFTFQVNDGYVDSNEALITIAIMPTDDLPLAYDSTLDLDEDSNAEGELNASDIDNDTLTYSIVNNGIKGTVILSDPMTGDYKYFADSDEYGADTFTFKVNDGQNDSNDATVSIQINSINDPPTAYIQKLSTPQNTSLNITLTALDIDNDLLNYDIIDQPSNGTLSGTGPDIIYTPMSDFADLDSFTFQANDGFEDSNTARIQIMVGGTIENNPPEITNPSPIIAIEDTAQNISIDVSDPDGDEVYYTITQQPLHGILSETGSDFIYTPFSNYNGTDSFVYEADDGIDSSEIQVIVYVKPINDPPKASNAEIYTYENISINDELEAVDIDDDFLFYIIMSQGNLGRVNITNPITGAYTYSPDLDKYGTDVFTFIASDGTYDSDAASITVTIHKVNNAPVAYDTSLMTNEDSELNSTLLAYDIDNDSLTYSIITPPELGTVSIPDPLTNIFVYTPYENENGVDSFEFKVNDGKLDSQVAKITVTISPNADPAYALNGTLITDEDKAGKEVFTCENPDNVEIYYSVATQPTKGVVTVTNSTKGKFTYTPHSNENGIDSFTFKVNESVPATITVTINPVNDAPTSQGQELTTGESEPLNITLIATDIDNDPITYSIEDNPQHGTLTGTAPNLVYTPDEGYNNLSEQPDKFKFKVSDGSKESREFIVNIIVGTIDTDFVIKEDDTLDIEVGYTQTYAIVEQPSNGSLSGTVYTPNANYNGFDSFTVEIDGIENNITVYIGYVNDPPLIQTNSSKRSARQAEKLTTQEDQSLDINFNITDNDNSEDILSEVTIQPLHGSVSGNLPDLLYIPYENYNGADSFTVEVGDGIAVSTLEIEIVIEPVNDAPFAYDEQVSVIEDESVNITLKGNDVENDTLSYTVTVSPPNGQLSGINPVCYTPNANYNGFDTFSFKSNDKQADSEPATVTINIIAINDAPVAISEGSGITTYGDNPADGNLIAEDVDNDTLTYILVSQGSMGQVQINDVEKGTYTYTPNPSQYGVDTFNFKVNDGKIDSQPVDVQVRINETTTVVTTTIESTTVETTTDSSTTVETTTTIIPEITYYGFIEDTDYNGLNDVSIRVNPEPQGYSALVKTSEGTSPDDIYGDGYYELILPQDTYEFTASKSGYLEKSFNTDDDIESESDTSIHLKTQTLIECSNTNYISGTVTVEGSKLEKPVKIYAFYNDDQKTVVTEDGSFFICFDTETELVDITLLAYIEDYFAYTNINIADLPYDNLNIDLKAVDPETDESGYYSIEINKQGGISFGIKDNIGQEIAQIEIPVGSIEADDAVGESVSFSYSAIAIQTSYKDSAFISSSEGHLIDIKLEENAQITPDGTGIILTIPIDNTITLEQFENGEYYIYQASSLDELLNESDSVVKLDYDSSKINITNDGYLEFYAKSEGIFGVGEKQTLEEEVEKGPEVENTPLITCFIDSVSSGVVFNVMFYLILMAGIFTIYVVVKKLGMKTK